jgi:hypothetical protein
MSKQRDNAAARKVNADNQLNAKKNGVTLQDYARVANLPVAFLEKLGLRTIDNPWTEGRSALAIPYRKRDGAAFRERIWQGTEAGESKARPALWDKREEKLGALLYGLDHLPASGCPIILVDDERSCHILWHHGFDAVGAAGAAGFYPKRDDADLRGLGPITVFPGSGGARDELLKRLSISKHRKDFRIAVLDGFAGIHDLHTQQPQGFEACVNGALAAAEPLDAVLAREPALDARKQAKADGGMDGTIADILVGLAQQDATFFWAPDDSAWGAISIDGRRETWSLRSKGFRKYLTYQYYKATGKAPNADAMAQALLTLDAIARYDGEQHPVFVRTAEHAGKYYVDLADDQWRAVEIDEQGWRITGAPPVRFQRSRGMLPLPEPVPGGNLQELRDLLNLSSGGSFTLIVAWLLAALRASGPYPLLGLAGEPGAAKSTTARFLRSLVDPNVAALRAAPSNERDCWIAAANAGTLVFDNLTSIPGWLSDALCRVATGGGFATRQLHTDDDEILFDAMRPTLLTAVGDVIARSDLADRAIMIELPVINDTHRMDEETVKARFEDARPRILGALLDAMVIGIRNRSTVKLARTPRLADFAVWTTACETAFTHPGGVMEAYFENTAEAVTNVIEGDAVCVALLTFLGVENNYWRGKPEELLTHLGNFAPEGAKRERDWPRNPQTMSSRLRLAMPSLRKIGVTIERGKTDGKRFIQIAKE